MTVNPPTPFPGPCRQGAEVCFDRRELSAILALYSPMVAAGEWRDYALACGRDRAVFAVFRRSSEQPLYRIEKRPALRGRQGMYAVIGADGRVLRRGHDLAQVVRAVSGRHLRAVRG